MFCSIVGSVVNDISEFLGLHKDQLLRTSRITLTLNVSYKRFTPFLLCQFELRMTYTPKLSDYGLRTKDPSSRKDSFH